jgi:hypothetical protein
MRIRTLAQLLCCALIGVALGCSDQPTTPSTAVPTPAVDSSSGASPATGPQTTVSPSRFGKRTPGVIFVTS